MSLQNLENSSFPPPPVMPGALISLRLLLSNPVADLAAIAHVIRNDIGLALELLSLSAKIGGLRTNDTPLLDFEELAVLAGIDQLRDLTEKVNLLTAQFENDSRVRSFQGYSALARRTARIAEQLASHDFTARPEEAYAAGLVSTLGSLPHILVWDIPELHRLSQRDVGAQIAKLWGLPNVLIDVVRGDRLSCSAFSLILLDLANRARAHALASDVEFDPED